jgi:hypothetical protein
MDIFTGICDIEHEHLIAVPYGYHMSSIRAYSNFLKWHDLAKCTEAIWKGQTFEKFVLLESGKMFFDREEETITSVHSRW